jgi:hypothetical protein
MKLRKTKHRSPKSFGHSSDKIFRGCGRNGYARCYGANKYGNRFDSRTRKELRDLTEQDDAITMLAELQD